MEYRTLWTGPWVREPSSVHAGWIINWHLRPLITDNQDATDSVTVATKARHLHERLEKLRRVSCGGRWSDDDEIAQVSDEFHTIGYVDRDEGAECSYFNRVLESLYDWADAERVIV